MLCKTAVGPAALRKLSLACSILSATCSALSVIRLTFLRTLIINTVAIIASTKNTAKATQVYCCMFIVVVCCVDSFNSPVSGSLNSLW